jgi:DNA-binding ferritin-like protein
MTPEVKLQAKKVFADVFLFYLQAHYYHWNITGRRPNA